MCCASMASGFALITEILNINPDNILPPEIGRVLVSKPFLDDPYFKRTVILLCDHNEEGSFGFVLNKYVDMDLSDIQLNIPGDNTKLAIGGPVENKNVYYIHRHGAEMPGSIHIVDDIYMGGSFEDLKALLSSPGFDPRNVRFFIGYSGWSDNQLLDELKSDSWYVATCKSDLIMNTEVDDLWKEVLKGMGGAYANLANFPLDPKMN